MAEDFIELGIEGIDKLVDKHFHKVPDKVVHPHTYRLHHSRFGSKRDRERGRESEEDSSDDNFLNDRRPLDFDDSQQRDEKRSPRISSTSYPNGVYEPPTWEPDTPDNRSRRRPRGPIRRSSSQPGDVRDKRRDDKDRDRDRRMRGKSLVDDKRGANTKESGQDVTDKVVLGLAGVAVSAWAVKAVMSRMDKNDDGKEDTKRSEKGRSGGGRDGRMEASGRRRTGGRR